MSVGPPGGKGMMNRTGFAGYACACAVSELHAGELTPLVRTDHGVHLLQVVAWAAPTDGATEAHAREASARRLWQHEQGLVRRRQVGRQLRVAHPLRWTEAWAPEPPMAPGPTTPAKPADPEAEEDDE